MGRIYPKICTEAIEGGDARPHHGVVALPACDLDGAMGRENKDSRVAVIDGHHLLPLAKRRQHRFGHLHISGVANLAVVIQHVEIESVRSPLLDPGHRGRICYAEEHGIGMEDEFFIAQGEAKDADARADNREAAALA